MARQGITQTQVIEAADALVEEGKTPTVQAVREVIGSGSYSTITGHLAEWKQAHQAQQATDIPAPPEAVMSSARRIWGLAWKAAQESTETERTAFEEAKGRFELERKEMTSEISNLEQLSTQLEEQKAQLEHSLENEQQRREQAETEANELRVKLAGLEEQTAGLQRENERLTQAAAGQSAEFLTRMKKLEQEFLAMKEKKTEE